MHGQLSSSSLSVLLWCNVAICLLPKLAHKVHIKNLFLGIERKHHLYHSRAHMQKKKKAVFAPCQMILAKERFPSYFQRPNAHYLPARLVCDKESLFTDAAHFVCVR